MFDTRRYQRDLFDFASLAKERGATVVLMTDPWHDRLARIADLVLPAPVAAPSLLDSFSSQLVLVEAIVATLADRLGDPVKARVEQLEQLRTRRRLLPT